MNAHTAELSEPSPRTAAEDALPEPVEEQSFQSALTAEDRAFIALMKKRLEGSPKFDVSKLPAGSTDWLD